MLLNMGNIDQVLTRAVAEILPDRQSLTRLMQQRRIKIYLGIDPSNPQIHLGNAVALRKLRQFQDLGHKVTLLIGDFTGMIGDPADKSATRKKLTREEVLKNARTYKDQASKIINFDGPNKAEIKFNSQWLSKLSSYDWIELISSFTSAQLEERDMFVTRKKEGKPVFMHEMIYPILQGYDSVAMDVDLEIGGTDQTFNMLTGRHLMKVLKNKEKFILTVPLLIGTDGQKMGKTTGNFIAITASPDEMFGKVMSIKDDLIKHYFELTTDLDLETIDLSKPMDAKKRLAFEIVKIYHGQKEAERARSEFEKVFQKGQKPEGAQEVKVGRLKWKVSDFLVKNKLANSRSTAKRLLDQGAIEIDGQTVKEPEIVFRNGQIVRIGKKKFVRIRLE